MSKASASQRQAPDDTHLRHQAALILLEVAATKWRDDPTEDHRRSLARFIGTAPVHGCTPDEITAATGMDAGEITGHLDWLTTSGAA